MDVCELEKSALHKKHSKVETSRVSSALAGRNNGTTPRSRREVGSRYRTPSPSVPSGVRRCSSFNATRTFTTPVVSVPERAISVERKRPVMPSSRPSLPSSTPVQDTGVGMLKRLTGNKLNENLWPSTMRSLSVSFQSDIFSLPVNKREKPAPQTLSDHTLRLSANVAHKQGDMSSSSRKLPKRKGSLPNGNNPVDLSENSRPVDGVKGRLFEQHRWLSRAGGKLASTASIRSFDLSDKNSYAVEKVPAVRTKSLSSLGSRHPSSKKASVLSSSLSRGVGPSQTKTTSFAASRGITLLGFIVDIRKGKKDSNHIEDAHQLRLLYNRHLQWMFANARAHAVLQSQKVKAEIIFYDVWRTIGDMWDLLIAKRIEVHQLLLALRLYSVLGEQLAYLEQWALVESDHTSLVSLITEDLRVCTLRLPITGSARGDIGSVKSAVCSTLDIMQAMASSICSLLSPVEGMNCLMAELAVVAARQRAMLIECRDLLASTTALQVEEYSIRTNLIQLKQSS